MSFFGGGGGTGGLFPGDAGGGFDCSTDGIATPCWMESTNGNTIFDAVRGVPGTFILLDSNGNLSYGFSFDLYRITETIIDNARNGILDPNSTGAPHDITDPGDYPSGGFQVYVHEYGNFSTVSGVVPDYIESQAALSSVAAYAMQKVKGVMDPEQRAQILDKIFSDPAVEAMINASATTTQALWEAVLSGSPALAGTIVPSPCPNGDCHH